MPNGRRRPHGSSTSRRTISSLIVQAPVGVVTKPVHFERIGWITLALDREDNILRSCRHWPIVIEYLFPINIHFYSLLWIPPHPDYVEGIGIYADSPIP